MTTYNNFYEFGTDKDEPAFSGPIPWCPPLVCGGGGRGEPPQTLDPTAYWKLGAMEERDLPTALWKAGRW